MQASVADALNERNRLEENLFTEEFSMDYYSLRCVHGPDAVPAFGQTQDMTNDDFLTLAGLAIIVIVICAVAATWKYLSTPIPVAAASKPWVRVSGFAPLSA